MTNEQTQLVEFLLSELEQHVSGEGTAVQWDQDALPPEVLSALIASMRAVALRPSD